VKVVASLAVAAGAAAAWLVSRGHGDPRRWPQALAEEAVRLKDALAEAVAAGRRAAALREQEIDRELGTGPEGPGP
jgi:hypothetical protein